MTYTPIARGTLNWDTPLNTALTQLDANTTSVLNSSLQAVNNLSDLTNVAQARSNLGLNSISSTTNNLTATSAPTTGNDGTQGYTTGSLWLNTTTSIWYRCVSNATSAAVWTQYIDSSTTQTITGSKTFTLGGSTNFTGTTNGQQLVVANGTDVTTSGFRSQVLGDTFSRWVETVDGAMAWGSGAAGRDAFLNRAAAAILAIQPNLLVGSNTALGDNGVGELQLANVTTPPSTNPTGGVDAYSQAGILKVRNPQGLVITESGSISTITASSTVNTTGLQPILTFNIPANDPAAGSVYEVTGYGVFTTNATATTMSMALTWAGTNLTTIGTAPTITASLTNAPFMFKALVNIRSTTSAVGYLEFKLANSGTNGGFNAYLIASSAAVTITTTATSALAVQVNFNNAQSMTLLGGDVRRVS